MSHIIRLAIPSDAAQWLELVKATLGPEYITKEFYSLDWIAGQFNTTSGHETWIVEEEGTILCSISFLKAIEPSPIANIGRDLYRPESAKGAAQALISAVTNLAISRNQMIVGRVSATDKPLQMIYEQAGYTCAGFQPLKHLCREREGILFYVHGVSSTLMTRAPISESLPQVNELAGAVLQSMRISKLMTSRDGATGYPLQAEFKTHEVTAEEYQISFIHAQRSNPPFEVSGRFNHGFGRMRLPSAQSPRALLAQDNDQVTAGMSFYFDEQDRCVRITEAFACDQVSMGPLLAHAIRIAQDQLGAAYTEIDILATAPRLLKSSEQLGFVPVAYFPAFHNNDGIITDVIKLVKLNLPYSVDRSDFTAHARSVAEIIDRNFEVQKMGMGMIKLLRPLAIFEGLGDGELGKVAHLFTQKLYRPGEQVFARGDSSDEAYVILRGEISIALDRTTPSMASLSTGKIFGELAFLDRAPRNACAVAAQPSILLVIKRFDFMNLVRQEPTLGMVVMRNIAHDLSMKLRNANQMSHR